MSVSAASPVTVNVSESVSVSVSVSASVPGRWSHQQQAQGSLAGLARQWALPSTELTAQTQSWAWRHPLQKCHTPAFAHTCNCEKRKEKGREGKGREGKGREGKGREGKGREDCTCWRQCNEKPSIILGCPGKQLLQTMQTCADIFAFEQTSCVPEAAAAVNQNVDSS